MRGAQLCQLLRQYSDRKVSFQPLEYTRPRNAVVILTKAAGQRAGQQQLERLRSRGNVILFDVVDERPPLLAEEFADVLIAASPTGREEMLKLFPTIRSDLVNHHVDPRIEAMNLQPPNPGRIAYFGELFNTFITDAIRARVEFHEVSTRWQRTGWLQHLPGVAVHYAIRRRNKVDFVKPFTKGFTAAHCGATILINASDPEAVQWLGVDYPYLLNNEPTEMDILEMLDRANAMQGTTEHTDALLRMEPLRQASSGFVIAKQLEALLATLD